MKKLLIGSLLLVAVLRCGPVGSQSPETVADPGPGGAGAAEQNSETQINRQIVTALGSGHYADAIRLVSRSSAGPAEVDFAVGAIILQGLGDPDATQPPGESVDEALALIEKSALSGHRPAISALAATCYTGLRKGPSAPELIAPNERLKACWEAAKTAPGQASACVAIRIRR